MWKRTRHSAISVLMMMKMIVINIIINGLCLQSTQSLPKAPVTTTSPALISLIKNLLWSSCINEIMDSVLSTRYKLYLWQVTNNPVKLHKMNELHRGNYRRKMSNMHVLRIRTSKESVAIKMHQIQCNVYPIFLNISINV